MTIVGNTATEPEPGPVVEDAASAAAVQIGTNLACGLVHAK